MLEYQIYITRPGLCKVRLGKIYEVQASKREDQEGSRITRITLRTKNPEVSCYSLGF